MIVLSIQPSLKPRLTLLLKLFGISALVGVCWLIATQLVFRSEFDVVRDSEPEDEANTNEPPPIQIIPLSRPPSNQTRTATQRSEPPKNAKVRTSVGNLSQDNRASSSPPALPESVASPQTLSSPKIRSTPQSSSPQVRSTPQNSSPQATSQRQSVQRPDTRSSQNQVASQPQPSPPTVDFSDLLAPPSTQSSVKRSLLPEEANLPPQPQPSQVSRVATTPPSPPVRQRPLPLPEPPVSGSPVPLPPVIELPQTAAKPQPAPLPPVIEPPPTATKPQPAPDAPSVESRPTNPIEPSPPKPAPKPTPPESIPEAVPPVSENVFVERFEVAGSTIFNPDVLALAAAQAVNPKPSEALPEGVEVDPAVINRFLSLAELLQASEAITRLYTDQNYINSGAYIPQDALRDGIATIQVVEGSLEDININLNSSPPIPIASESRSSIGLQDIDIKPNDNRSSSLLGNPFYITRNWLDPNPAPDRFFITGNRPLNPGYIRRRLAIAGAPPLNLDRLLEGVQLLQLNPLIETISTEVAKGTQTGTSILNVNVTQADSSDIQFSVDNGRSPSVGSVRQRAQVSQGNFLGLGDRLLLGYSRTEGSEGWDASYTLPINPRNGTISLSLGSTSSEVIEAPFNFLDIQSASRYYELTLRQPLIQTPTEELALSLTASRRESESEFLRSLTGTPEPFPAIGADAEGNTQISALRFSQEWTKQGEESVLALQSQFSLGLDAFNSTINPIPPDSRFFSWRGQAQWVRRLGSETLLLLRGELQLADRPLVPLEQFGLGGQNTIRGYRQDTLLTDNGWLAAAELRLPILRIPEIGGVLQLTPFLEIGKGWNSGDATDPETSTLVSTGLGLLWRQDDFTARLDWGIPLTSVSSSGETLQENGIHFSVIYSPF